MRVWLTLHVLAAIAGIGPEIAFGMMGPRARRDGDTAARTVSTAIAEVRARIVYPALLLQVVSGIALIVIGRHDVFGERWLAVALALYATAMVIVAGVLAPGSAAARRQLAAGVAVDDPRLRPVWRRQALGGALAGSLLITVAVLMVWKPGA